MRGVSNEMRNGRSYSLLSLIYIFVQWNLYCYLNRLGKSTFLHFLNENHVFVQAKLLLMPLLFVHCETGCRHRKRKHRRVGQLILLNEAVFSQAILS